MIAHNASRGVLVDDSTIVDNDLTENSIFANADPGIELVEDAHGGIAATAMGSSRVSQGRLWPSSNGAWTGYRNAAEEPDVYGQVWMHV